MGGISNEEFCCMKKVVRFYFVFVLVILNTFFHFLLVSVLNRFLMLGKFKLLLLFFLSVQCSIILCHLLSILSDILKYFFLSKYILRNKTYKNLCLFWAMPFLSILKGSWVLLYTHHGHKFVRSIKQYLQLDQKFLHLQFRLFVE